MKRFLILTQSLFLSYLRDGQVLFWNLAFPIFLLLIYRVAFSSMNVRGYDYMTWVAPGVVALNILSFGLIGSAAFMTGLREQGALRRLQATPVPTLVLFAAFVAVNLALCLAQSALVIGFSALAFGVSFSASGWPSALVVIVLAGVTAVALGQSISSLAPRLGVALAIGQLLYFVQMFTAGLVLPFDMMPAWVQDAARFTPAYAIGELTRWSLLGQALDASPALHVLVMLAYTAVAAALAVRFFRWQPAP